MRLNPDWDRRPFLASSRCLVLVGIVVPHSGGTRQRHSTKLVGTPEVSQEILRIIRERPGISMSELRARVSRGWGTVYYHVSRLTSSGLICVRRSGRRSVLYVTGTGRSDAEIAARALLRGTTIHRVADHVARQPHSRIRDIAESLGESERVVYYHVKQLLSRGMLTSDSGTRRFGLRATPLLVLVLAESPTILRTQPPPSSPTDEAAFPPR